MPTISFVSKTVPSERLAQQLHVQGIACRHGEYVYWLHCACVLECAGWALLCSCLESLSLYVRPILFLRVIGRRNQSSCLCFAFLWLEAMRTHN